PGLAPCPNSTSSLFALAVPRHAGTIGEIVLVAPGVFHLLIRLLAAILQRAGPIADVHRRLTDRLSAGVKPGWHATVMTALLRQPRRRRCGQHKAQRKHSSVCFPFGHDSLLQRRSQEPAVLCKTTRRRRLGSPSSNRLGGL